MENIDNNIILDGQISKTTLHFFADSLLEIDDSSLNNEPVVNYGSAIVEPMTDILSPDYEHNDGLFPKSIYDVSYIEQAELKLQGTSSFPVEYDELTGAEIDGNSDRNQQYLIDRDLENSSQDNTKQFDSKTIFFNGLEQAFTSLLKLSSSRKLESVIERSFGSHSNSNIARTKIEELVNGEAEIQFSIVPQTTLQARGGYAQSENTVYIAAEFLADNYNNTEVITAVILEELGHYIDHQLNEVDTPGDEGAIFSRLTLDQEIEPEIFAQLRQENDLVTVEIAGQILKIEQAENISLGNNTASIIGDLSPNDLDNPLRIGSYYDDYQLNDINVGNIITVDLFSSDFDSYLQLINADTGESIVSNDDGGGGLNSRLVFLAAEDINYIIRVTSFDLEETGNYQLQINAAPIPIAGVLSANGKLTGNLSSEDVNNPTRNGRYSDDYQLADVSAGEEVIIDLTAEFDTYLQIIDADTQEILAENNDFGTETNSQIKFTPAENINYLVRVTSNNPGEIGEYTLKSSLLPNLTIIDAKAPAITNIGHIISATWITKNTGDGGVSNSDWNDLIYLSDDEILDENDELISSQDITISDPLIVGGQQSATGKFAIPDTTTGSRYLLFVADGEETQVETRDDDNVFFLPIEIADFQPLVLGETISSNQKEVGYKFSLSEDTLVNFDSLTNNGLVIWALSGEDGVIVEDRQFNLSDSNSIDNSVLKLTAGDYVVVIDSSNSNDTSYSFRLSDLAQTEAITPSTEVLGTVTPGNGTQSYQFDVEAGERFYFDYLSKSGFRYTPNWTLINPEGEQVFDQPLNADIQATDLTQSGTYTLLIEGQISDSVASGSYSFNIIGLEKPQELVLGETINATLKQDRYSFTLDEDSLLYFDSLTNNGNLKWSLTNGAGEEVVTQRLFTKSDSKSIDNPVLDLDAGEYTLQIYGNDINDSYSFTLSDLNQAIPLTFNTPINDSFEQGKKTDLYQFTAEAGDRFFFDYRQIVGSRYSYNTQWRLIDSQGNELFDQLFTNDAKDIAVPESGTYTLLVENSIRDYNYTSSSIDYRFQVAKVSQPVDLTFGATLTDTLSTDTYSFTLNESKQIYVDSLLSSNFSWTLTNSSEEIVATRKFYFDDDSVEDPILDLEPGQYKIKIDGSNLTDSYSFAVKDLDAQGGSIIPGEVVVGEFNPSLETDIYKFDAVAGDRFFIDYLSGGTYNSYYRTGTHFRLVDPDGNYLIEDFFKLDKGDIELNRTGTYTILLEDDLSNRYTGEYSFNIRPMITTPQKIDLGEVVTGDITTDQYRFTLDEDKLIYVDSLLNSDYAWTLTNSAGEEVVTQRKFSETDANDVDDPVLDLAAGDYSIKITGLDVTGNYSFNIRDIQQSAIDLTPGEVITGNFEPDYQSNIYQFDAEAGERFYIDYLKGAYYQGYTYWRLLAPDGSYEFESFLDKDLGAIKLNQTGTYTLLIEDDVQSNLERDREYSFNIRPMIRTPKEIDLGEVVTGDILTDEYSFTLDQDNLLYFDSLTNNKNFKWSLTNIDEKEVIVNQRLFTESDASDIDQPVLDLSAGEYLLKIDGNNPDINYSFRLSNLNQAKPLNLGTQINDSFGQGKTTNLYQFEVQEGERYFFDYQQITGSYYDNSLIRNYTQWRLIDPEGNEIFDQPFKSDANDITVEQTGTYTLLIENSIIDYPNGFDSIDYRFQAEKIAADLTVSNPKILEEQITWGEPFTLQWQVANEGSLTSTGWSDRIYLSKDNLLDENDILIDSFNDNITTVLTQGQSIPKSQEITIDTLEIDSSTNWYILVEVENNQQDANQSNDVKETAIELLPPKHADLVIDEVTVAEDIAFSGGEIEVSWQGRNRNLGDLPTDIDTWRDRIVISEDDILDDGDRQLDLISYRGELDATGIYSNSATVKLPEEISGDYYIFVDADYNQDVFEFVYDENNHNFTTEPINISLKPVPDLEVSGVTADAVGKPGETITVNWIVSNTGEERATGNWQDGIYLSPDGTLNNALKIGKAGYTEGLAVGSNYPGEAEITLPTNTLDGEYQIVVVADDNNQVFERDGEDNNQGIAINTTKIVHPDIIPTLIDYPATALSGSDVALIGTATNQGSTATIKSWKDKVYISDNETFEPNQDRLFGEFEHTEALEVGKIKPVPINTSLPQDIIGNKYVLIVSDADNDLQEAAGENNNVQAYPIDIELAPYADLEVSDVNAPSLTIDDPATVKVSWTVTNKGTGAGYTDTWIDRVIASSREGDQDDIILGEFTHTGGLASGATYPMSEDILLPPAFTGRYDLFVQTDAEEKVFENGLEDNNIEFKKDGFFDVMPIPYADLRIDQVRTIGEANSGQPLTVNWTVRNDGIGITNTSRWNDRLYLARDPEGKNLIQELGSFNRTGALANENPENTYNRTVQVNLPEGISGEHYIVAKTGGPFEFIYDDNNSLVSKAFDVSFTAPPDLKVTDIIAPDAITSGQKINLTWSVINQGNDAQGKWQDQIYLQEVGNPDARLISLASYSYEGDLLSGKSYTRKEKIKIPDELQGLYQVVVKTNSNQSLYEANNTANNQKVDPETLLVSLPPRPDLQVVGDSIVAPDKVSAGGTVEVQFNIINDGTAATNIPNWTDTVYLSLDNQISSDDIVLDTVDNKSALEPGKIYPSFAESIVIPKRFRGDAYLIVETDSGNQVNELPQENNNTRFKKIEVEFEGSGTGGSGQAADLFIGEDDVLAPDQVFAGSTIEVKYKVTNKGTDTTDVNSWQDTIWLTKDQDRPSATNRQDGEVEDILLKTITHTGALTVNGIDNEYEKTIKVKIPEQLTGEWYITPWSDTYDVVLEDTLNVNVNPDDPNELDNNNYKARPIKILLTPPADLRVKKVNNIPQIEVTPEAVGGDPFEVTWTVENFGAGATNEENWVDRVYLSDSPTLDAPNSKQWFLGEFEHHGGLAPGGSYSETANFALSPAAAGKYVIVDVNAEIPGKTPAWEGPYTENNATAIGTNVTNNPADLVVKQVTVPQTSNSGAEITVDWLVENQGADMWPGTKYWYDEVWISPDPTLILERATFAGAFIHTPKTPLKHGERVNEKRGGKGESS